MMFHSVFRSIRNTAVCFAASVLFACGVSDRKVNEGTGGTPSGVGSGGANAGSDQGGTSAGGTTTNSSGSGGKAGEAGEAGTPNAGCVNDSMRCDDSSTPSKCIGGNWTPQDPCPTSKPACSNGVCAVATLSGGIVTVSNGVLSTGSVRLVEHGLEYTQTVCGMVGTQKICITGGIRP
jgi:hypothetical protein